ncbi:2-amino-4-hydroxy-6-hydroxymethyldihydropteridine diphosphokinase [Mesonia sp. MT50]|uniref:2-amino-4-hydroxy-6-hydroxymethyldihydropteridine pyrophosphokinase n=1 Tax=Mesonia profundi TaxID=3070998 RepID=A0ABU1A3X9_9FLAO|nr:2-amino-4-hydroxy-6-hydroxymethyldihydropteridine diphosphokinase [Mesonia profundi]MDQ7918391.1 2-amino-4-hydroxy-6-hydroxymethyldihydropteridine diphosphokinase [Mesonia profundi]
MKKSALTYIGLGSNQGDKLRHLQTAVDSIQQKIGEVVEISSIYETPAFGFNGQDFFNACVAVNTRFSAQKVLVFLQEIEKVNGRQRATNGYEDRSLDLDILLYGIEIIELKDLQVPHPHLHKRDFVLFPLAEIAPESIHPQFHKSITQLKTELASSGIKIASAELKLETLNFQQFRYIAIEGNIGAGKTSLATMIAQDYKAKLICERFKDNPFLPKFYKDQQRYAFSLEMSFLADRYQQLLDDISQYDLFADFMVADYDVYKSLIFAEVTLQEEEFNLYKKLFQIMYKDLAKPDLYVYLYQSTERLLENIKKRGRSYEQEIPADYLENINKGYLNFIKNQHHLHVKIIDITHLDFVNSREDYVQVLRSIQES